MARLRDIAQICKSKNAGPFFVTVDVLFTPYDAAAAFKATLPRRVPAGDIGDTDVYGAQQHAPLLDVEIPLNAPPSG